MIPTNSTPFQWRWQFALSLASPSLRSTQPSLNHLVSSSKAEGKRLQFRKSKADMQPSWTSRKASKKSYELVKLSAPLQARSASIELFAAPLYVCERKALDGPKVQLRTEEQGFSQYYSGKRLRLKVENAEISFLLHVRVQ